jgi:hypothetical protein
MHATRKEVASGSEVHRRKSLPEVKYTEGSKVASGSEVHRRKSLPEVNLH